MGEWLDGIEALLRDSLGERELKRAVYATAREIEEMPDDRANLRGAFREWVAACGFLREPVGVEAFKPWSILRDEAQIEIEIRDKHRYTRGANIAQLVEEEKRDQAARWEVRVNRCVTALIEGWPDGEAITFVYALDEWYAAKKRAEKVA